MLSIWLKLLNWLVLQLLLKDVNFKVEKFCVTKPKTYAQTRFKYLTKHPQSLHLIMAQPALTDRFTVYRVGMHLQFFFRKEVIPAQPVSIRIYACSNHWVISRGHNTRECRRNFFNAQTKTKNC